MTKNIKHEKYRSIPWYKSVRFLIPLILVAAILVPTVGFWTISIQKAQDSAISHANDVLNTGLVSSSLLMEDLLSPIEEQSFSFAASDSFAGAVSDYLNDPNELNRSKVTLQLGQFAAQLDGVEVVFLITNKTGEILTSDPGNKVVDSGSSTVSDTFSTRIAGKIEWAKLPDLNGKEKVAFMRDVSLGEQSSCSLVCVMSDESWKANLQVSDYDQEEMYVATYDRTLLFSSKILPNNTILDDGLYEKAYDSQEKAGSYVYDGTSEPEDYFVAYYWAVESGLLYIAKVPMKSVVGDAAFTSSVPFWGFMGGLAIVGVLVGFALIYYYILRPINALLSNMRLVEQGGFREVDEARYRGEMMQLIKRYNHMTGRLKKLIEEVYV